MSDFIIKDIIYIPNDLSVIKTDNKSLLKTALVTLYNNAESFFIQFEYHGVTWWVDMFTQEVKLTVDNSVISLEEWANYETAYSTLYYQYTGTIPLRRKTQAKYYASHWFKPKTLTDPTKETVITYPDFTPSDYTDIEKHSLFFVNGYLHNSEPNNSYVRIIDSKDTIALSKAGRIYRFALLDRKVVQPLSDGTIVQTNSNMLDGFNVVFSNASDISNYFISIAGTILLDENIVTKVSYSGSTLIIRINPSVIDIKRLISSASRHIDIIKALNTTTVPATAFETLAVWEKLLNMSQSLLVDLGPNSKIIRTPISQFERATVFNKKYKCLMSSEYQCLDKEEYDKVGNKARVDIGSDPIDIVVGTDKIIYPYKDTLSYLLSINFYV